MEWEVVDYGAGGRAPTSPRLATCKHYSARKNLVFVDDGGPGLLIRLAPMRWEPLRRREAGMGGPVQYARERGPGINPRPPIGRPSEPGISDFRFQITLVQISF